MDDQNSAFAEPASLEAVLITDEVLRRSPRAPDYELESHAHCVLVETLASTPEQILQCLAQEVMKVCNAGSAGISLLNKLDGEQTFVWPAVVGAWGSYVGAKTPRDFGPCAEVLARGTALVFRHPELHYPYLQDTSPSIEEGMLAPVYVGAKAVGTVWVISHEERRKFDSEDLRRLTSLSRFASIAFHVCFGDFYCRREHFLQSGFQVFAKQ